MEKNVKNLKAKGSRLNCSGYRIPAKLMHAL
jgi:hypothetical protein